MGYPEALFADQKAIPIRLFCSICLDICQDAMETTCNHLFCEACITESVKVSPSCPNCRHDLAMSSLTKAVVLRQIVGDLHVFCAEEEEKRCGWKGPLSNLQLHLRTCSKVVEAKAAEVKAQAPLEDAAGYTKEGLTALPVKHLVKIMHVHRISHEGCLEKGDLVDKILESLAARQQQSSASYACCLFC